MTDLHRIARHLFATHWQVKRAFPRKALSAIAREIKASESRHDCEIRFAVECALSGSPLYLGQRPRERAIDVFSHLRMWDTDNRNGVLIYLLFADRAVEIVFDRGVHKTGGADAWNAICGQMENAFRSGEFEKGAVDGIRAITQLLSMHYPAAGRRVNALPDSVVML